MAALNQQSFQCSMTSRHGRPSIQGSKVHSRSPPRVGRRLNSAARDSGDITSQSYASAVKKLTDATWKYDREKDPGNHYEIMSLIISIPFVTLIIFNIRFSTQSRESGVSQRRFYEDSEGWARLSSDNRRVRIFDAFI